MSIRFRFFAPVLLTATLSVALAGPALAARPGGGGGGGGTGATITFDSTQVTVGMQYRVTGTGFKANTWVTFGAYYPDTTWWSSGVTDGQGNFAATFTATGSGQILHEAKEQGNNGRVRLMASATLTVNPAP
jgi:hypothetical protein